jgi:hypothetical protein
MSYLSTFPFDISVCVLVLLFHRHLPIQPRPNATFFYDCLTWHSPPYSLLPAPGRPKQSTPRPISWRRPTVTPKPRASTFPLPDLRTHGVTLQSASRGIPRIRYGPFAVYLRARGRATVPCRAPTSEEILGSGFSSDISPPFAAYPRPPVSPFPLLLKMSH